MNVENSESVLALDKLGVESLISAFTSTFTLADAVASPLVSDRFVLFSSYFYH